MQERIGAIGTTSLHANFQRRPELMVATKQERYILNLDFVRGVLRRYVCDLSEETLFRRRGVVMKGSKWSPSGQDRQRKH